MLPTGLARSPRVEHPGGFSSRAAAGEHLEWIAAAQCTRVSCPTLRCAHASGCAQSSRVELSSSVGRLPRPSPVEFCAAEAVSTVWRRMRTSTHSFSRPGHSLVAEDTVSDVLGQESLLSTVPLGLGADCSSLLMSQHSGSSLVRKVS